MHLFIFNLRYYLPNFSAILSIFMIGYCLWKGRRTKLLYSYILLLMIIAIYSAAWGRDEADWLNTRYLQIRRVSLLFDFAEIYIGYIWFLFFGLYTGSRPISHKRTLGLLLIPPSLLLLARLTNDYHQLYYVMPFYKGRIFYWLTITVDSIYILMGIMMMIQYAVHQLKNCRSHSILLIFSAIILLAGNLLDQLMPVFDIQPGLMPFSPAGLSLSVVLLGLASFKYRFLNIIPIGRKKIMKRMKESMMIIDQSDTVVNYNQSFKNNFPEFIQTRTGDLHRYIKQIRTRSDNTPESSQVIVTIQQGVKNDFSGELTLLTPEWQCFSVNIQPILTKHGEVQGRIVLFDDITRDKKLLRELQEKNDAVSAMNQELAAANEHLENHARTVEELAMAKERNRIARDIHDSVGQNMTLLIQLLELTITLFEQNSAETKAKLIEVSNVARESLQELRRSIRNQTGSINLLESLQKLFANFETSGIQIDFSVKGVKDYLHPQYAEVIYRTCQEGLTNAVRHGNAKKADVILHFDDETIKLYILDNGRGCQTITKGVGLNGMEQRVNELKGTIQCGSSGEIGFNIIVEIPIC